MTYEYADQEVFLPWSLEFPSLVGTGHCIRQPGVCSFKAAEALASLARVHVPSSDIAMRSSLAARYLFSQKVTWI